MAGAERGMGRGLGLEVEAAAAAKQAMAGPAETEVSAGVGTPPPPVRTEGLVGPSGSLRNHPGTAGARSAPPSRRQRSRCRRALETLAARSEIKEGTVSVARVPQCSRGLGTRGQGWWRWGHLCSKFQQTRSSLGELSWWSQLRACSTAGFG